MSDKVVKTVTRDYAETIAENRKHHWSDFATGNIVRFPYFYDYSKTLMDCPICNIKNVSHLHEVDTKPKDFTRILNEEPVQVVAKEKEEPKRILLEADDIINPDKRSEEADRKYGPFSEGMDRAAMIMSGATGKDITGKDMYIALVALKLSRESYNHKRDNLLDGVAYLGGLQDYIEQEEQRNALF